MNIHTCGTEIKAKYGGIEGMITAVEIRFSHIRYEVTYWHGTDQTISTVWLHEAEFATKAQKKKVGFEINGK